MVSREKQLTRLKKDAQRLWLDQQELLGRANSMARVAYPHAQYFARERLVPGVSVYAAKVLPLAGMGTKAGLAAAGTARDAVISTVVPAVSSATTAAIHLADQASSRLGLANVVTRTAAGAAAGKAAQTTSRGQRKELATALKVAAAAKAAKGAAKVAKTASDSRRGGPGVGGTLGLVLGVAAVAGIGYAVWQTLRADDDLWVADDEPETTTTGDVPTV